MILSDIYVGNQKPNQKMKKNISRGVLCSIQRAAGLVQTQNRQFCSAQGNFNTSPLGACGPKP